MPSAGPRALAPLLLLAVSPAIAKGGGEAPAPLFDSDTLLEVHIAAPFGAIAAERPLDEYVPARLTYTAGEGELVEVDVSIRARGRYRRRPSVCAFPPLRLNFKTSDMKHTAFARQDKLKLVTHCQPNSFRYEQALLAEYLTYRILNILTDHSFRVRLLHIEYANTDTGSGTTEYAFLIEHQDALGKRIGLEPLTIEKTTVAALEPDYLNLTSVFHYLIGNTDFSPIAGSPGAECCHNHTLFGDDGGPRYSIPYDFDMAGLVAPPHAIPNAKLRLESVKERLYRGRCVNNDLLPQTLAKFEEKRAEIEALINAQPELSDSKRREMRKYIDEFYRTMAKEKTVNRRLAKRCEQ